MLAAGPAPSWAGPGASGLPAGAAALCRGAEGAPDPPPVSAAGLSLGLAGRAAGGVGKAAGIRRYVQIVAPAARDPES